MASTTVEKRFEVPADEMWQRIGDFHRLHEWHPAIANVEPGAEPALRNVTLAGGDGTQIVERLVDEGPLWHTYVIEGDGGAMRGYRSTIRVREDGPSACVVEWQGQFEADDASEEAMVQGITGFYQSGLDSL
jgi:hypothetical protein